MDTISITGGDMKAVVFADRAGRGLRPLTDRTCAALLPVAGRSVLAHTLDALAAAGVTEAVVVISPHADAVERALGDGTRWGLRLDYALTRGDETPDAVLARLRRRVRGDLLVLRGDMLRTPVVAEFLAGAAAVPGPCVAATIGGVPAEICLLREGAPAPCGLSSDPDGPAVRCDPQAAVAVDGARMTRLESLAAYHRANCEAAAGGYAGLVLPGVVRDAVRIARHSRVAPDCVASGPVQLGARCDVRAGVSLCGPVVLGDDVCVDRGATLAAAVVLPGTRIGEHTTVTDAIVWGNELIQVPSGRVMRVDDPLLLADLDHLALAERAEARAHQGLAVLLLVASLPLWPLALLAAYACAPRRPLRRMRVLGNASGRDAQGLPRRREVAVWRFATPIPLLRHLPALLAAAAGHLRLVGVTPLTAERQAARTDHWQRVRDRAPVGLFGPAQVGVARDADDDERWVVEGYYARTRTVREDLGWLLRGLGRLVAARPGQPVAGAAAARPRGLRERGRGGARPASAGSPLG